MFRPLSLFAFLLLASASVLAKDPTPETPQSLFVFLFEPGPAWVVGKPMERQDLREHAAYHARLVKVKRSFAGGGFVGRNGGMAIIRARDLAEAEAIRDADPAIMKGVFTVQITGWLPHFVSPAPLVEPSPQSEP